jgi:predicted metal-dependent HD superfamily phosphohydrolase
VSVTLASWQRAWHELGAAAPDTALFNTLIARYSEKHRHYHTLQHLRECLEQFDAVRGMAQRPAEIELALWFHDAVYDPQRQDNEALSADWARDAVLQAGLPDDVAPRIHALIMDTLHLQAPTEPDARLLVDVDLSILGADPARFDESDAQIRAEFAHVPDAEFRQGRRRVLNGFLSRPRLYSTERFYQACEQQARANLQRSLARLAAQG